MINVDPRPGTRRVGAMRLLSTAEGWMNGHVAAAESVAALADMECQPTVQVLIPVRQCSLMHSQSLTRQGRPAQIHLDRTMQHPRRYRPRATLPWEAKS